MWSLKRCPRLEPVREDNESLELLVNHGRQVDSLGGWPVWRNENRGRYDRSRLRYPSDLTDEEWGLTEPLIPPSKRGGNRRTVNVARSRQRPDVCLKHRLPVAGDPQGLAAALDGVRLF